MESTNKTLYQVHIKAAKEYMINFKNILNDELNKMPTDTRQLPCPYILIYQSYILDEVYIQYIIILII